MNITDSDSNVRNAAYLKWIESNPASFDKMMHNRRSDLRSEKVLKVYQLWRESKQKLDNENSHLNRLSDEIAKIHKTNPEQIPEIKKNVKNIKSYIADLESAEEKKRYDLVAVANLIPNILLDDVPFGHSDKDNVEIEVYGDARVTNLHHEDIAIKMGFWHREQAVNMSGSRFILLGGELARLERALCQFALDYLTSCGFYEMSVPYIVNKSALFNSGQLDKFEEMIFAMDNRCLIPTGEVPLVNYFANQILTNVPCKLTTFTQCFRKEAGSLGKDTKGMIRVHQFSKVEMVCVTKPENSNAMHMEMLNHSKKMLEMLELPYRVVKICAGDIGFTAMSQYDLEVWMPGQGKYVEVASCSNCGDFQAQRMNLKYVDNDGKKYFAHTLNGTGLSGRVVAGILENFFIDDKLNIPRVLDSYYKAFSQIKC